MSDFVFYIVAYRRVGVKAGDVKNLPLTGDSGFMSVNGRGDFYEVFVRDVLPDGR